MRIRGVSRQRHRQTDIVKVDTVEDNFIKNLVEEQDTQSEASRMKEGYIHASSLLKFCPRAYRIAAVDEVTLTEGVTSAQRVMWMIGRAVEHHVRTQVIASIGRKNVYGLWRCHCGDHEYEGVFKEGSFCRSCAKEALNYYEATAFDHTRRIGGNPDLQLIVGGKRMVVEIKSINKKDFDALLRPQGSHIFQASSYHRILTDSGVDTHPVAAIFYVSKDFSFRGSPYREFHITPADTYEVIDLTYNEVDRLRSSEDGGQLPVRLSACQSISSPTAKACPLAVNCFSRNE